MNSSARARLAPKTMAVVGDPGLAPTGGGHHEKNQQIGGIKSGLGFASEQWPKSRVAALFPRDRKTRTEMIC